MRGVEDVDFAIAFPDGWREIDLLAPDAGEMIDGALAEALATASRGSQQARVLMLRGLLAVTESGEPLGAGLAVTVAYRTAPVSTQPLNADGFAGGEVSAVQLPAGAGLRVRRLPQDGVLRVQYLLETALGLLTITFTTFQAAQTVEWERLFDAMAATAELSRAHGLWHDHSE
jgi:hypothetical protein